MHIINRRAFIGSSVAGAVTSANAVRPRAQPAGKRFRMLLNTSFSGPQAWMLLAQDNGLLAREGLELELVHGSGAYTAAPRVADGGFDLGYGDINSLIEVSAREPSKAPLAVFVAFNASPSTVAVDPNGPVKVPRDLEGKTILGHSSNVALKTFGAFCKRAGVDASRVRIVEAGGGMLGMVESMLGSRTVHGVFGYVSMGVPTMVTPCSDAW